MINTSPYNSPGFKISVLRKDNEDITDSLNRHWNHLKIHKYIDSIFAKLFDFSIKKDDRPSYLTIETFEYL